MFEMDASRGGASPRGTSCVVTQLRHQQSNCLPPYLTKQDPILHARSVAFLGMSWTLKNLGAYEISMYWVEGLLGSEFHEDSLWETSIQEAIWNLPTALWKQPENNYFENPFSRHEASHTILFHFQTAHTRSCNKKHLNSSWNLCKPPCLARRGWQTLFGSNKALDNNSQLIQFLEKGSWNHQHMAIRGVLHKMTRSWTRPSRQERAS